MSFSINVIKCYFLFFIFCAVYGRATGQHSFATLLLQKNLTCQQILFNMFNLGLQRIAKLSQRAFLF